MNELIIIIAGHRPVMCYSLVNRNEKNPFKIYASASSSGSPPQSVDLFVVSHTSHPDLKKSSKFIDSFFRVILFKDRHTNARNNIRGRGNYKAVYFNEYLVHLSSNCQWRVRASLLVPVRA